MINENKNIDALCRQIEKVLGRELKTTADFDLLYASIISRTHQAVGTTTLKRLFGYVTNQSALRRSTLDILSQFAGYVDWTAFCNSLESGAGTVESNPILSDSLSADAICLDDVVRVNWNPDRECLFRCTGNHTFVVEASRNSKLSVGTTFICHLFINGEPLYLENLVMQGSAPTKYVCGRLGGILYYLQ